MINLSKRLEVLFKGTGLSCMCIPEKNEIYILDWIQGETSLYKTDTLILQSDLTYRFSEAVDISLGKEVPNGVTVIASTSKEDQAKFVARQHSLYMLQRALSCCML